jgi:hypothetical protein
MGEDPQFGSSAIDDMAMVAGALASKSRSCLCKTPIVLRMTDKQPMKFRFRRKGKRKKSPS